jgi:hypothetical protein
MLFGIGYCRRKTVKKRRPPNGRAWILGALLLTALVVTGLLFIAPQWLLVLLVIMLTAALFILISCPI